MKPCLIALLLLITAGCSAPRGFYVYRVASLPDRDEGTVYVEATGLGRTEKDAGNDAAFNAFKTILFTGLPNSIQKTALVDDENKARQQHPDIINCFNSFE